MPKIHFDAPIVLVFDVNETLLDIEALHPLFARLFGDERSMREWFAQLVLYSQATSLAGIYAPFGQLGAGVLQMVGQAHGVAISVSDIEELRSRLLEMPAHPEVAHALQQLREAGFRMVTLTNSAPDPQASALERAGLAGYFDRMFSVDDVRRFKPAPDTYRYVAAALQVEMGNICLVAAHTWDTLGAQALGCSAAFIARPGNAVLPVEGLPQPDIIAPDLTGVAQEIIQRWRRGRNVYS
jgi:2-haloacid dehalogenase